MSKETEELIQKFCMAWSHRNIDELLEFFTEDAVYHNIPMDPMRGHEAIRQIFQLFVPPAEEINWKIRHIASVGPIVFTERVDRFLMRDKSVPLPVAGVFDLHDGKIAAWRDYTDMSTWLRQTRD